MSTVEQHDSKILKQPFEMSGLGFSEWAAHVRRCFRSRLDLNRLHARLRRDAGIDDLELERTNFAKSPLIK